MKKYYHFIGLIILVIILSRIDYPKLISNFSKINLVLFLLSNLLVLLFLFIKAYRWRYILHLQGINYPIKKAFVAYLGGIFAGIITPGRIGETIKALYLKKDKNLSLSESLASIFIDRFLDLYLLVLFGSLGFIFFLNLQGIRYTVFISVIIVFALIVPLLFLNKYALEKIALVVYELMISKFDKSILEGQFKIFLANVKKIIIGGILIPFGLTILAYLIFFGQCYILIRLTQINLSYLEVTYLISISNIISILPITFFGLGVREAGLIYLLSLRNVAAELALTYSFLLFMSFYVINGFFSFLGWQIRGGAKCRN